MEIKNFKKVLVANRGEIAIRVFRACTELGIKTVAVYSKWDRYALFRTKADESYLIGEHSGPIDAYLNINEIISLAVKKGVDAIHPGYGFLSENAEFARACEQAGITFIGPKPEILEKMGDKIQSKIEAQKAGIPVIPGIEKPITSEKEALRFARECGYPVILKAAYGGGGRGMRIVKNEAELSKEFRVAYNEAKKAFGSGELFIEKYLDKPKHIEVQILADNYGNVVHLYERDCSIQRRHQKLIEFSPALCLNQAQRESICEDALKLARAVGYQNAGTVEFLFDGENHYFIEMNPRIQVEHTVTEMVTGIDIVQSQIKIAEGYSLDSDAIGIKSQKDIQPRGYSIQCRITTEDPKNNFAPDTGKINVYRSGSGFGIRLDAGNAFTGAIINPYYDSLLVKVTSWDRTFKGAAMKAARSISELRVRGVKTNVGFLLNVLHHPDFISGKCHTGFIDETPELFSIKPAKDRATKILKFIGEKIVNGNIGDKKDFNVPKIPKTESIHDLRGTKQLLDEMGPEGLSRWILNQKKLLLTDTTFRDAHQSLLATRVRTLDMLRIAQATSLLAKDLFSLEMWGGATFDVAYRFLKESPWDRLSKLREKIPNILFQMLLRGSNAVGYKNYPDNLIRTFIQESAKRGIDVFRIFDALNWLPGMEVAIEEVLKTGKVAEACICYTGDILDERRDKYTLEYYINLAKDIEKTGVHILGIKDMAGLLKPYAAFKLIKTLKEEISIPIHLHTHDTSGNGVATILFAAEAGVDIVDTAFNSMSGLTSQPPLNSVVAALENTERETGLELDDIQKISDYWSDVRPVYEQFESGLKSGTAEIYKYEIPGGQYSNLKPQVESLGLGHRLEEVKQKYKEVNDMLGDIIKVTPTSKVVGDLAIFMVKNDLTKDNIIEKGENLSFPDSVVAYFKGLMGQPLGGFPKDLQKVVLKNEKPLTGRPGELLQPIDFEAVKKELTEKHHINPDVTDILSYCLYPKVFEEYLKFKKEYGDVSNMESHVFFYGLKEGETFEMDIEEGKTLIIKLISVGELDNDGTRAVVFELNGMRREIIIKDKKFGRKSAEIKMANMEDKKQVGASIPGTVLKIMVKENQKVKENDILAVIEAMKMETNVIAPTSGIIDKIHVKEGQQVKNGQLLMQLK